MHHNAQECTQQSIPHIHARQLAPGSVNVPMHTQRIALAASNQHTISRAEATSLQAVEAPTGLHKGPAAARAIPQSKSQLKQVTARPQALCPSASGRLMTSNRPGRRICLATGALALIWTGWATLRQSQDGQWARSRTPTGWLR